MLVCYVVLDSGTTAKVRVISDGWVLAGFEGSTRGGKRAFDSDIPAFLVLTRSL